MLRKQFKSNRKPSKGETNNKPSCTIPDETLTIKQLLDNHTRGQLDHSIMRDGQYFETPIPTILDPTDLTEHRENLKNHQYDLEEQIKTDLATAATERQNQIDKKLKETKQTPHTEKPTETPTDL